MNEYYQFFKFLVLNLNAFHGKITKFVRINK